MKDPNFGKEKDETHRVREGAPRHEGDPQPLGSRCSLAKPIKYRNQ
jgi:hypothetical protein